MRFLFVGDSSTRGDCLAHPEKDAWPALVAKHHGSDFLNAAQSGGSNESIMYQLVKNIDEFDRIYVVWSGLARFTRWDPENYWEVNFTPHLASAEYKHQYKYKEFGILHFAYWVNYLQEFKRWLQSIILVQTLLESRNKEYVMLKSLENNEALYTGSWEDFLSMAKEEEYFNILNDAQLKEHYTEIQNLVKQINLKNFIGWGEPCLGQIAKDFPLGDSGHPLEEGHQFVAKYVIDNEAKIK